VRQLQHNFKTILHRHQSEDEKLNRKLFLIAAFSLLLGTAAFMSVKLPTAAALVPSISSVTSRDEGSTAWVDIVVIHQPPPDISPTHYVTVVQLTVNGTTVDLPQTTQTTETFTVQYSLGPNTDTYTVTARAMCNVHGYSGQSNPVVIPESISAILVIALATVTVALSRKALGRRKESQ
jgi:desulfoferrodoxin (superoxide reductase-like protein)